MSSFDGWGGPTTHTDAAGPSSEGASTFDIDDLRENLPADADDSNNDKAAPLSKLEPLTTWTSVAEGDTKDEDDTARDWDGNARVYEWDNEYGDVGPEYPELELQLFGDPARREKRGTDFAKIAEIELFQEGPIRIDPIQKFADAGLHPVTMRNIELAGYKDPTPIQRFALPAIREGHDLIAIAQTGSGKTAAYLIPILDRLMGKAKKLAAKRPNPATFVLGRDRPVTAEPLVCIICPNRELAVQVFNESRKFCYRTMLRPCVVYGGCPRATQVAQLAKGCDVLVATPGRFVDFIDRPEILSLGRLKYMVIDEADEMLQDDWQQQFAKIVSQGGQNYGAVQYMLFSATFPKRVRDLAKTYMADDHVRLRVGRAGSTHENITQNVVYVLPHLKPRALYDFLEATPPCRILIFVNQRRTAEELDSFLYRLGLPCSSIHAERSQLEREASMRAFRRGDAPILIATGVTARGIDVLNVSHVINYDLPSMDHGGIEEYTHRIGRTGRIGHHGTATSFYTDRDEPIASVLTRTLLETKQEVPDFLSQYIPQGDELTHLKFEADSDFEGETGNADDGDASASGWGGDAGAVWAGGADAGDAEGADADNSSTLAVAGW